MKVIHLADVHFNKIYKGDLPIDIVEKISFDQWENFSKVCTFVKNENIDIFLIAGDLFEREYFTLSSMKRLLSILEDIKIPVFIVCGNHDFLDANSLYNNVKIPANVHIFSNKFSYFDLDDLKTRIFGISYDKEYFNISLPQADIRKDYTNILLIHGIVDEGNFLKIDKSYAENFDYVAMGHIHKGGKVYDNTYYSGSLEPLSFKEDGDHGFIFVDFLKNELKFVKTQIKAFRTLDINVREDSSVLDIFSSIQNQLNEKDLFRIRLDGNYGDIDYLLDYLKSSLDGFYIEIENNIKPAIDIETISRENENNILGQFISSFDLDNDLEKEAMKIGIKYLMEESDAFR